VFFKPMEHAPVLESSLVRNTRLKISLFLFLPMLILIHLPKVPVYHKRSLTCFCDGLNIDSKELIGRVRQATKDVVKSEV